MVLIVGYQVLLNNFGLEEFILHGSDGHDSRVGFLNANREGLFSCCGYLALYLISIQLGHWILKPRLVILNILIVNHFNKLGDMYY